MTIARDIKATLMDILLNTIRHHQAALSSNVDMLGQLAYKHDFTQDTLGPMVKLRDNINQRVHRLDAIYEVVDMVRQIQTLHLSGDDLPDLLYRTTEQLTLAQANSPSPQKWMIALGDLFKQVDHVLAVQAGSEAPGIPDSIEKAAMAADATLDRAASQGPDEADPGTPCPNCGGVPGIDYVPQACDDCGKAGCGRCILKCPESDGLKICQQCADKRILQDSQEGPQKAAGEPTEGSSG